MKEVLANLVKGAFLSALIVGGAANAAVIHQVEAGKLIGAKGVMVGTTSYDVQFVRGTCASVFGTCSASSFEFITTQDALAASNALLNTVLVNLGAGRQFDNQPNLVNGCSSTDSCSVLTPYATRINSNGVPEFSFRSANNTRPGFSNDSVGSGNGLQSATFTFARWSPTASEVPEPSSIALIGLAMAGLAFSRRRKS